MTPLTVTFSGNCEKTIEVKYRKETKKAEERMRKTNPKGIKLLLQRPKKRKATKMESNVAEAHPVDEKAVAKEKINPVHPEELPGNKREYAIPGKTQVSVISTQKVNADTTIQKMKGTLVDRVLLHVTPHHQAAGVPAKAAEKAVEKVSDQVPLPQTVKTPTVSFISDAFAIKETTANSNMMKKSRNLSKQRERRRIFSRAGPEPSGQC
jgi:hypothetical protein